MPRHSRRQGSASTHPESSSLSVDTPAAASLEMKEDVGVGEASSTSRRNPATKDEQFESPEVTRRARSTPSAMPPSSSRQRSASPSERRPWRQPRRQTPNPGGQEFFSPPPFKVRSKIVGKFSLRVNVSVVDESCNSEGGGDFVSLCTADGMLLLCRTYRCDHLLS